MMGRKTSVSGSKTPAAKQGKPTETSKAPKRQQRKPAPVVLSNGIKKKPVKSKPGFSLYPAGSRAEGDQQAAAAESARAGSSTKPGSRAQEKIEPSTEVVSQMQLQEEKAKSSQASSFYIPTADIEDSIHGQECDDFPVSAPFNKRLVSSTPDPERLVEAECEDQYNTAVETEGPLAAASPRALVVPPEDSPQMIPERDVTTEATVIPPDSTGLAATVAKGLAEKLKLQREAAHSNKRSQPGNSSHSEKAKQTKSGPLWKQKHQKWQEELEQYKKNQVVHPLGSERNNGDILNSTEASEIVIEPSHLGPMTKAEWISDSRPSQASKSGATKSATDNRTKAQMHQATQNIVGMNEMRKSIEDSGIQSIEVSTSAVSAVKANVSVPAQLPTTQSSFQGEQAALASPDHYIEYESFKSGILQNVNNSGMRALPLKPNAAPHITTATIAHSPRPHTVPATTVTTPQSCVATMASTVTHTATVTSSNSSVKVCETVTRPSALTPGMMHLQTDKTGSATGQTTDLRVSQDTRSISKKGIYNKNSSGKGHNEIIPEAIAPTNSASTQKSNEISASTASCLDSSSDSQDPEPSKRKGSCDTKVPQNQDKNSKDIHNTSYLSEVIKFLKTDGFNAKEKTAKQSTENKPVNSKEDSQPIKPPKMQHIVPSSKADDNLTKLMSQYLPLDNQEITKSADNVVGVSKPESNLGAERGPDQGNVNNSSSAQVDRADNNQNYNSDDSSYDRPRRRKKSRNLYYLENMGDPKLRDIACRLAFKATALRDIELRDLIDDMIFHTDAALGHEDARYQSSNLFLQEENSKLKKRLHNVNRQLDAKERQEKMASTSVYSISNNEILHMERKMMHLRQEKDRLDAQLTTLLEEKARWLVTQQDLVKTISLKDHEIIKLEEKYQQERIKLHQSLDHATQNSQGVHYKLSVADREINNMEQRLKCRDLDIADLREKLRLAELSVGDCKQEVTVKDQEIYRLKDMVDTLKLGVDHVLQMFENGSTGQNSSEYQRQGMESLYRMAHPERFMSGSNTERKEPPPVYQSYQPPSQQQGIYATSFRQAQTVGVSTQTSDHMARSLPIRPEPRYPEQLRQTSTPEMNAARRDGTATPEKVMSWMNQRLQNLSQRQSRSQTETARLPMYRSHDTSDGNRLTAETLEEHNQRLSPVDRRLWRSMQESPVEVAGEPYYSDSEIELTKRESRRFSSKKSPKSILKCNRGRSGGRYWQTSTPVREGYYQERDRERNEVSCHSCHERSGRARRKSESDKYASPRGSHTEFSKSHEEKRKRVRSATPRERGRDRSRQEESDEERDDGMSSYFKKKSQMPSLPKTPERESRGTSRSKTLQGSQSSKLSTIYSVPISKTSSTSGFSKSREKSTSTPISRSLSQDDQLIEVDIETSSTASSDLYMRQAGPSSSHEQRGNKRDAWNTRSYSPSSLRKLNKSKKSERRSRSLENDPREREREFSKSASRSTSQEQGTRLRTLEPDSDSSYADSSPRQSQRSDENYFSPRKVLAPNRSGQKLQGSQTRVEPSPQLASSGQSNGRDAAGMRSDYATRGSGFLHQSAHPHVSDVSLSRRATHGGNSPRRKFYQGTELSDTSLSSIEDDNNGALSECDNNNQMRCLNEDLFSTGIASLDMKIANLQKKIDRAKAVFS